MISTPVRMQLLNLWMMKDDAQRLATALADMSVLHLQEMTDAEQDLAELPAREFHDIHHRIKSRYSKIMAFDNELLRGVTSAGESEQGNVTLHKLGEVDEGLRKLWSQVSAMEEQQRQLKEQAATINQLTASLQRFHALEVDLSRLGRQSQFLNVQAGTINNRNRARLERALSIIGFVMEVFYSGDGTDYVIVVGSAQEEADLQELLKSADFRPIAIPDEFSDRPHLVERQLQTQFQELEQKQQEIAARISDVIKQNGEFLVSVQQLLNQAMPYASLANFLRGKGNLVALQGWVPEHRCAEIEGRLKQQLHHPFHLMFRQPTTDELELVPTQLHEHWWSRPFQLLVRQYGLPQYGEIDPSSLFALSYVLMFGMMFGDVGHGAIIMLGSLALTSRSSVIAIIGGLAGLSSIVFGFLYGSVFGYEDILHPLWMSPMHDPQHVLLLALYWGIGFLIIANLLSIRNMLARHEFKEALYSPGGAVGLVFYIAAVYSLMEMFESSKMPFWSMPFLTLLMAAMLYQQWQHSSGGLFERVLVVAIEGLEIVISNVSATLSFLRVAAFALNHIALAAAVFALAAMLDTFGHWVAILLGNVFIIVLEGAIVAIQCLRLEYYEGFSRFFSGKGKLYQPLKTDPL